MKTYELFQGEDLEVAELIQQRRLQILVHSCIYYKLNRSIVSDKKWDEWAKELVQLQSKYPNIASQVIWYEDFKDWDASTGAFLPLDDPWVMKKAQQVAGCSIQVKKKVEKKAVKRRLF